MNSFGIAHAGHGVLEVEARARLGPGETSSFTIAEVARAAGLLDVLAVALDDGRSAHRLLVGHLRAAHVRVDVELADEAVD